MKAKQLCYGCSNSNSLLRNHNDNKPLVEGRINETLHARLSDDLSSCKVNICKQAKVNYLVKIWT